MGKTNFRDRKWRPFKNRTLEELYERPAVGCWPWRGTVNSHYGSPIYKGWTNARPVVYERHRKEMGLPPLAGHRLVGRTCGDGLCVRPDHQNRVKYKRKEEA